MKNPRDENHQGHRKHDVDRSPEHRCAQTAWIGGGQTHQDGGQCSQDHQPTQIAVEQFAGMGLPAEVGFQDAAAAGQTPERLNDPTDPCRVNQAIAESPHEAVVAPLLLQHPSQQSGQDG